MRGKEAKKDAEKEWIGITPAYAGKRGTISRAVLFCKDHPRVCGEK